MTDFEFKKDKLVLYFEEDYDNDDEYPEMRCYVLFDHEQKEYFIAGKKSGDSYEDFKFYCKNINDVYTFLTHSIDKSSKVNIILYNVSDIYDNAPYHHDEPYLNYYSLDEKTNKEACDIITFSDCLDSNTMYCDNDNNLFVLLKMLKKVRY